jgi:hypothetical protein
MVLGFESLTRSKYNKLRHFFLAILQNTKQTTSMMSEKFELESKVESPENIIKREKVEKLRSIYDEAESIFEAEGREKTKPLLGPVYTLLSDLNKTTGQIYPFEKWNPEGDLTEDQFNEFNLRRKKLSNAVGIMTASGVVRHDLNEI